MSEHIYHHGIKGMKWGVRRFQNADGSLTSLGKARYGRQSNTLSSDSIRRIGGHDETSAYGKNLYVSVNDADFEGYRERSRMLPSVRKSSNPNMASVTTFAAKRPLKVANNAAAVNYLFTQYDPGWLVSPQDAEQLHKRTGKEYEAQTYLQKYNELMANPNSRFLNHYGEAGAKELVNDVVGHMSLDAKKRMFDYFSERGYDAMYDPEDNNMVENDGRTMWTESTIVFDPANSLTITGRAIVEESILMDLRIPTDEILGGR